MSQSGRGGPPSSGFLGGGLSNDLFGTGQDRPGEDAKASVRPVSPRIQGTESGPSQGAGNVAEHPHLPVIRDLRKSGLQPTDIQARILGDPEKAACGIHSTGEGYVIPYFDVGGDPINFYRTRILNATFVTNGIKYKQPRKTPNHIYFPRNFRRTLKRWLDQHPHERFLLITEGEKKAACADKQGFPCIGLGGVDSWRSRTILLPEDTEFYTTPQSINNSHNLKGQIRARLPSTDSSVPELVTLARGFGDFIDLLTQYSLKPIIVYDSDSLGTVRASVQRAATMLAYELVYLGIHSNMIKQVILPSIFPESSSEDNSVEEKRHTGLDDFIMERGPDDMRKLIQAILESPQAFPRHPNPKGFISTQLQGPLNRKVQQQVAAMILTELDASGKRLREKETGAPFYYDRETHVLFPAIMMDSRGKPLHETSFGTLLYQKYGVSINDQKVLGWLASQFTGEEPIEEVTPKRVIALITEREDSLNPHGIAFQVSDSQFIAISPDPKIPITLCTNGTNGILFESDQVDPLDVDQLLEQFDQQYAELKESSYSDAPLSSMTNWWSEVLEESNIGLVIDSGEYVEDENGEGIPADLAPQPQPASGAIRFKLTESGEDMRRYASLLYYISPFLFRWRGLQLPVEITVGAPGSGKSSLYALRLNILTGRPRLRNIPNDIRDWQASVANSGGLHVTDNVHFLNRELKQRISDEICRITTEPTPIISMRKYYTEVEEITIPVSSTFAFTSLSPPFHNEDLIQRTVTFQTGSVGREPKGDWVQNKIEERGGREAWVAHHLLFLHLFLRRPWDENFHTQHRLAHLEQTLLAASNVFRLSGDDAIEAEGLADADADIEETEDASYMSRPNPFPRGRLVPPVAPTQASKPALTPAMQFRANREARMGEILKRNQQQQLLELDWILRGIKGFIEDYRRRNPRASMSVRIHASDIAEWASVQEEYEDNDILTNTRKLGRYMVQYGATLASLIKLVPGKRYMNRETYHLLPEDPPDPSPSE
jgi:Domain of unknown function (DUF3854)